MSSIHTATQLIKGSHGSARLSPYRVENRVCGVWRIRQDPNVRQEQGYKEHHGQDHLHQIRLHNLPNGMSQPSLPQSCNARGRHIFGRLLGHDSTNALRFDRRRPRNLGRPLRWSLLRDRGLRPNGRHASESASRVRRDPVGARQETIHCGFAITPAPPGAVSFDQVRGIGVGQRRWSVAPTTPNSSHTTHDRNDGALWRCLLN